MRCWFHGPGRARSYRLADDRAQARRKGIEDAGGRGARAELHCHCCRWRTSAGHEWTRKGLRLWRHSGKVCGKVHMFCELNCGIRMRAKSPLDRRSFLNCALASGAALGIGGVAKPAAAMPPARLPRAGTMRASLSKQSSTRSWRIARSSASSARANARWETRSAATAACARIAAALTTRWCTRGSARRTSIPSRRSRSSTICRGRLPSR